jgi:ethanolamine utilization protein EutN
MRIAQVIGRVTLARAHDALPHGRLVIVAPLTGRAILHHTAERQEDLVAFDELGAAPGDLIALSEGRDAVNPFGKRVPVDSYCAMLIDQIDVGSQGE